MLLSVRLEMGLVDAIQPPNRKRDERLARPVCPTPFHQTGYKNLTMSIRSVLHVRFQCSEVSQGLASSGVLLQHHPLATTLHHNSVATQLVGHDIASGLKHRRPFSPL